MGRFFAISVALLFCACGSVKDDDPPVDLCGNGVRDDAEQCDQGADNGAAESCCEADCTLIPVNTMCRTAASACDVAEACNGIAGSCPSDETLADGMPCTGNGESSCSAADTCDAGLCIDNDLAENSTCGTGACDPSRCNAAGACVTRGMRNIIIVESQSISTAQNMDDRWLAIATANGHTAAIHPQTVLDDIANLSAADILIVASHEIAVPANRIATIRSFMMAGGGVYIQGEYQAIFAGNVAFEAVADGLGANFSWGTEVPNAITMTVPGCLGSTPAAVPTMTQNFGVSGTSAAPRFVPILTVAGGVPMGFAYCRPGGGEVMVTTDKDLIRGQTSGWPEFMRNALFRLSYADTCHL
ncbi:MAG TPA: hypothetical protein VIU61_09245 [Kofleriaceae bacterium]